MKKLNLKMRLLLLFIAVGVIPLTLISIFSYIKAKTALENSYFNQLRSVNGIKKSQVESYFEERYLDVENFANDPFVMQGMGEFDKVAHDAEENKFHGTRLLDYDLYKEANDAMNAQFKDVMDKYGYEDIFLISKEDGLVVYSGVKGTDFGTFMSQEKTHLSEAWKEAVNKDKTYLTDTKIYTASNSKPAQFITTPIRENGNIIGILGLKIPLSQINKIMSLREGMGESGESYLVGEDKLMRSDSFEDKEGYSVEGSFQKNNMVDTEAVKGAFANKPDTRILRAYNGSSVLSDFKAVDIGRNGIRWALMSEIDETEAFAPVKSLRLFLLIITVVVIAGVGGIGFYFGNSIANPILLYAGQLKEASESVYSAAGQVSAASQQLSDSSNQQASSIEETSASLEEMTGMVTNNVDNAEKSTKITEKVRGSATNGNESMQSLIVSMKEILESNEKIQQLVRVIGEIGDKTAVIDEIVFQTKLLSFNASVEAERAGEHGRGFAVVAQEVGNLAQMSGKAAAEISAIVKESIRNAEAITSENKKKVEAGNNMVKETAKVLQEIKENSDIVSKNAVQILNASKDQSSGITQINNAMAQLDKATQENATTSEEVASSSEKLTNQAESLNEIVGRLTEMVTGSTEGIESDVRQTKKVSVLDNIAKGRVQGLPKKPRLKISRKVNERTDNADEGSFTKDYSSQGEEETSSKWSSI